MSSLYRNIEFLRFEVASRSFCVDVDQVLGVITLPSNLKEAPTVVPFHDEEIPVYSIEELLDFVQLAEKSKSKVDALSGGMKRRLTIARGLINEPDMLILDEPTTGLDPQARHVLWDRLYRLKQKGVTLIITTHYMEEAEQLCDRLVIMDKAKIVAEGSPRSLIEEYAPREVVEIRFPPGVLDDVADRVEAFAPRAEILADRALLYTDDAEETISLVTADGLEPETILARRSSLEDVFLRLTGRSLID